MREVLARRRAKREEMVELARQFVLRAVPALGKAAFWLYGSVARGDFNIGSDVDVLVVAETLPLDPFARAELLLSHAPAGVEPRGLTRAEFERLLEKDDANLRGILAEAVLLRDDLRLSIAR